MTSWTEMVIWRLENIFLNVIMAIDKNTLNTTIAIIIIVVSIPSVDSYVVHWRARGQQTWETRTILVPPVDRPTTEKVKVTEVNPKVEKVMTVKSYMFVYAYLYTLKQSSCNLKYVADGLEMSSESQLWSVCYYRCKFLRNLVTNEKSVKRVIKLGAQRLPQRCQDLLSKYFEFHALLRYDQLTTWCLFKIRLSRIKPKYANNHWVIFLQMLLPNLTTNIEYELYTQVSLYSDIGTFITIVLQKCVTNKRPI